MKKHPLPAPAKPRPGGIDYAEMRQTQAAHMASLRHLYHIAGPIPERVSETDHMVSVRDGTRIRVRVYVPTQQPLNGSRPLIVMFHEGGWAMGELADEDLNCRMFARDLGAVCVNVEYRLAPEYPFPTPFTDAYDALEWCAQAASPSSSILPADPTQGFIVGGASAGGNISAVVAQMARDKRLSLSLTGQYLCVPALLYPGSVPEKWQAEYRSRYESASDPSFRHHTGTHSPFVQALNPDLSSPLFSPLLHPNLSGLPPAYFQLAGLDPLRDEGLLYERVLRELNDTRTKLDVYNGFGHMFWNRWPELERSREFVKDTLAGVKWLLEVGRKAS